MAKESGSQLVQLMNLGVAHFAPRFQVQWEATDAFQVREIQ
jgi:hypothetical protein